MKTAKLIKDNLEGFNGHAAFYELSEPLDGIEKVIVSAVSDSHGYETYIFPADNDGDISDWGELEGSMKGTVSHAEVLGAVGYTITRA